MIANYNDLQQFKELYDKTERDIISRNIRRIVKSKRIKYANIADALSVSIHTVYAYTKEKGYTVKPDLFVLLMLSAYMNVDTNEFFVEGV